jgi:hypothetical protein
VRYSPPLIIQNCNACSNHIRMVLFLRDKDVILIVDETTDIKNRKVLNILAGPAVIGSRFRLVSCEFLDKCNSVTVSNAILECLRTIDVQTERLICVKSDNARYMLAAGVSLQGICGR